MPGISTDARKLAERVDALEGFRTIDATGPHKGKAFVVQRWDEERQQWRYVDRISAHASYGGLALVRAETGLRNKGVPLPRLDKTPPKEERMPPASTTAREEKAASELRHRLSKLLNTKYGGDSTLLARDAAALVSESDLEQFGGSKAKSRPADVAHHALHAFLDNGRTMSPINLARFKLVADKLENGGPPVATAKPSENAVRAAVNDALRELARGMSMYDDGDLAAFATFARRAGLRIGDQSEREAVLTLRRFLDGGTVEGEWVDAFDAEAKVAQVVPPNDQGSRMVVARSRKYLDAEAEMRGPSEELRERLVAELRRRDPRAAEWRKGTAPKGRVEFAREIAPLLGPTRKTKEWNSDRVLSWLRSFVTSPAKLTEPDHLRIWNAALDALDAQRAVPEKQEEKPAAKKLVRSTATRKPTKPPEPAATPGPAAKDEPRFAIDQERVRELYEELDLYKALEEEWRSELAQAKADAAEAANDKRAVEEELAATDAERERLQAELEARVAVADGLRGRADELERRAAELEAQAADLERRTGEMATREHDAEIDDLDEAASEVLRLADRTFTGEYRALLLRLADRSDNRDMREQVLRRLDAQAGMESPTD